MKIAIRVALLIVLSVNVYSQPLKLKFGLKAGLAAGMSQIEYPDTYPPSNNKMKFGVLGGCFVNMYLNENIIFQPGVHYIRKGLKDDAGFGGHFYKKSFNYLEVPLNLLFKFRDKKKPFYVGAGFSPAFKANRYYTGEQLKGFDFGINAIGGYIFPIGVSINLGYTHGILNVTANENNIKSIRNRNFSLAVGYEF